MPADAAKAGGLLFLAVVIQLSVMANVDILGGHPNLLLVTLVSVSLLRGAVFGAVAGFCVGLLAIDRRRLGRARQPVAARQSGAWSTLVAERHGCGHLETMRWLTFARADRGGSFESRGM